MAGYVGLDPDKDINWVTSASVKPIELFVDGKIDAFLGFPPEPQELRARQIRPCDRQQRDGPPLVAVLLLLSGGERGFRPQVPIATKRALRAILKAADVCATEPERVAQLLVDGGLPLGYDYALQTLNEIPYDRGGNTTRRTRSASMPCACTRSG